MRLRPRMNKYERREMQQEKKRKDLSGSGLMVYENNTGGELTLPKKTDAGISVVGPHKRFQGDSYFMKMVGFPLNMLKLIEVISPARTETIEEEQMPEEKLILDQPDTITHHGKIEHVAHKPCEVKPLNDNAEQQPDVLLNEYPLDPLDGVEIILN